MHIIKHKSSKCVASSSIGVCKCEKFAESQENPSLGSQLKHRTIFLKNQSSLFDVQFWRRSCGAKTTLVVGVVSAPSVIWRQGRRRLGDAEYEPCTWRMAPVGAALFGAALSAPPASLVTSRPAEEVVGVEHWGVSALLIKHLPCVWSIWVKTLAKVEDILIKIRKLRKFYKKVTFPL